MVTAADNSAGRLAADDPATRARSVHATLGSLASAVEVIWTFFLSKLFKSLTGNRFLSSRQSGVLAFEIW